METSTLISCIHTQWKSDEIAENAERMMEGAAMVAKKYKSKDRSPKDDTSKKKRKKCKNCKKTGHTKEECYDEGGGAADKAPDWFIKAKEKRKDKDDRKKKGKEKSANAANTSSESESENAAACGMLDWITVDDALICSSEYVNVNHIGPRGKHALHS